MVASKENGTRENPKRMSRALEDFFNYGGEAGWYEAWIIQMKNPRQKHFRDQSDVYDDKKIAQQELEDWKTELLADAENEHLMKYGGGTRVGQRQAYRFDVTANTPDEEIDRIARQAKEMRDIFAGKEDKIKPFDASKVKLPELRLRRRLVLVQIEEEEA